MGLFDFFGKLNLAADDPNKAMFAGLQSLGLELQHTDGAVSELAGTYAGREAAMVVDGSAITGVAKHAYGRAAGTAIAGALGLISPRYQDWQNRWTYFRARTRMQGAQMKLSWAILAARPVKGAVNIGRDSDDGQKLGQGLYGSGHAGALGVIKQPALLATIGAARFDEIAIHDRTFEALWTPPMSEYQKVARSPQTFTETSRAALAALAALVGALAP